MGERTARPPRDWRAWREMQMTQQIHCLSQAAATALHTVAPQAGTSSLSGAYWQSLPWEYLLPTPSCGAQPHSAASAFTPRLLHFSRQCVSAGADT